MKQKGAGILLTVVGIVAVLVALAASLAQAEVTDREKAASEVAASFLKELGEAMTREMTKGGPTEAINVCAELAPEIAGRLSREQGWRVTRVGTRVRNHLLGMPDAWEQRVLAEFSERAAKGETFAEITHHEVVMEPGGRYFRFMQPIMVQPKCQLCHGPSEQIPDEIRMVLRKRYPFDAATGYKVGELRGAVSIKQPLGTRLTTVTEQRRPVIVREGYRVAGGDGWGKSRTIPRSWSTAPPGIGPPWPRAC